MFKRKLFKRALPFILSVAMMFESLPATAMATESSGAEQMTEVGSEEDEEGGNEEESTDLKTLESETPSDEPDEPSGEKTIQDDSTGDLDSQSANTENPSEGGNGDADVTESSTTENTTTEGSGSETPSVSEITTEEESTTSIENIEKDGVNPAAEDQVLPTKIVVKIDEADNSTGELKDENGDQTVFQYVLSGEKPTFTTTYDKEKRGCGFLQDELRDKYIKVYVTKDNVDEELDEDVKRDFTFEWAKEIREEGKDPTYSDAVKTPPVDAGTYKLTIKLSKLDGVYAESSAEIIVNIEQAELTLGIGDDPDYEFELDKAVLTVNPGKTVAELKEKIKDKYTLTNGTTPVDKAVIAKEDSFVVNVYESNGDGETPIPDEQVISAKKEGYILKMGVELKDQDNYKVKSEDFYVLKVAELRKTAVEVTLDDKVTYPIKKIYNNEEADLAALVPVKVEDGKQSIKVTYKDKDDREVEIPDAIEKVTADWYVREQILDQETLDQQIAAKEDNIIDDTSVIYGTDEAGQIEWKYKKLDAAPKDAGEYYVIWKYAGDEDNAYKKAVSSPVNVTIERAPAVVTVDKESLTGLFHEGMGAADVNKALLKVEYHVYPMIEGADGKIVADTSAQDMKSDDFFGTAYAGDTESQTAQFYQPEFELVRAVSKKAEGTNLVEVKEEDKVWQTGFTEIVEKDPNSGDVYEYKVRLTGKKVVYGVGGAAFGKEDISQVSTDSSNKNYQVQADENTRKAYAELVSLAPAKKVEIDTQTIVDQFNAKYNHKTKGNGKPENPVVKIYDENGLFERRSEYKTVAKDGQNAVAGTMTYEWRYTSLQSHDNYVEMSETERKDHPFESYLDPTKWTQLPALDTDDIEGILDKQTKDAQIYELTIKYTDDVDDGQAYWAEDARVYFKVEQQQIVIVPGSQVAQDGQAIAANWLQPNGVPAVNLEDWTAYKLTDNDEKAYADASEEARAQMDVTALVKAELTSEELPNEMVQHKDKKNAQAVYEDNSQDKFDKENFDYRLVSHYNGKNYTTKSGKVDGKDTYHDTYGTEIKFIGDGRLYFDIDTKKITELSKVYDGQPVTLPADWIKIYSDENMKNDVTETMLNIPGTIVDGSEIGEEDNKVNVYWQKKTGNLYRTPNVIWGGEYELVLKFKGNEQYQPIDGDAETGFNAVKVFADDKFTISKRDITIKPQLAADMPAGEKVADLAPNLDLITTNLAEGDQIYFNYTAYAQKVVIDNYEGRKTYDYTVNGGYPAFYRLNGDGTEDAGADYRYQVDDKDHIQSVTGTEYLRFNRKYTVSVEKTLIAPLNDSYNVTWLPESQVIARRGQSEVQQINYGEFGFDEDNNEILKSIPLTQEYDGTSVYSVKPLESIKFYYDFDKLELFVDGASKTFDAGNYIAYRIYAPSEFENDFAEDSKKFIIEKAVKAKGGYVLGSDGKGNLTWTNDLDRQDYRRHYIVVLFPVTQDDPERKFDITWEDNYTDTFKLVNVELEANLAEAVAPKSIAFNGVQTKMAVGERQQLNVKITKKQLSDVIKVRYRLADGSTKNDYVSIDPETGIVTALKTNNGKNVTTQVVAYPVYYDKDGKPQEITAKGVKTAKTKITVTEVAAPKIKKILLAGDPTLIRGYQAAVQFTDAGNGYRREIYVLEKTGSKTPNAAEFESRIASVKNEQYREAGFAIEPVYSYASATYKSGLAGDLYDPETKLVTRGFKGLEANKTYVVYVRNVSAVRTLDDGSIVDLSSKGAVKTYKTTLPQVQALRAYFKVNDDNTPVDAKNPVKYLVTDFKDDGTEVFEQSKQDNKYEVNLFAKTAQVYVSGQFVESFRNDWADTNDDFVNGTDQLRFDLPLAKDLKRTYLNPKLVYTIVDSQVGAPSYDPAKKKWNVETSKYATINNKGKITLKGVDVDGEKTVYIYVAADNGVQTQTAAKQVAALTIKANVTSVSGKKAKLNVGDKRPLSDFLEYKYTGESVLGKTVKNKKVLNYKSSRITITDDVIDSARERGYDIYDKSTDPSKHDWWIEVLQPNKAAFSLTFTDRTADGTEITPLKPVTLTSTPIKAVSSLKAVYVDDKFITINFKHAGTPDGYEIELLDARKSVIEKRYVTAGTTAANIIGATEPAYIQSYQKWNLRDYMGDNILQNMAMKDWHAGFHDYELAYFEKTKTYAYTFDSDKILRLSSYTVKVTPVYNNQRPKTVSRTVKTTNIPAAREVNLDVNTDGVGELLNNGGIAINYYIKGDAEEKTVGGEPKDMYALSDKPYFQAGNVYTLVADSAHPDAMNRVTDTLTWKSSNTKVATVKANPGTYTATMRPLKSGVTTISITSKITKKVIARWDVMVKAIGNGDGYAGDYEPAGDDDFFKKILAKFDPFYDRKLEVLSITNPVTVKNTNGDYDRTWVSFTAPSFGEYTFTAVDSHSNRVAIEYYDAKNGTKLNINNNQAILEEGQKIYMKLYGDFMLSVTTNTDFARLTIANDSKEHALEVKADEWVSFTAPEDNYYTFTGDIEKFRRGHTDLEMKDYPDTDGARSIGLKKGETLLIQIHSGKTLYVTRRVADKVLELKESASSSESVQIKSDHLEGYIRFTAPVTNRYDFEVEYANELTAEVYAADGKNPELITGDGVLEVDVKAADGDTTAPTSNKYSNVMYLKAGEIVFFKFSISKDDFPKDEKDPKKLDASKTFDAKVTVTSPTIKDIKVDESKTITKKTVEAYQFKIPSDKKNVKYTFGVQSEGAVETKYYDSEGNELTLPSNWIIVDDDLKIQGVTSGSSAKDPVLRTDELIFIQVKASDDKDATLKITAEQPAPIKANVALELTLKENGEYWYTFTAEKDGVYKFDVVPTQNEDKDKNPAPSYMNPTMVKGAAAYVEGTTPIKGTMCKLKAGETYVFVVKSGSVSATPEKPEDADTKAKVSVIAMTPAKLNVGDNAVEIKDVNAENYYEFVVETDDEYTFKWTADTNTDKTPKPDAVFNYSDTLNGAYKLLTLNSPVELKSGEVKFIKATSSQATSGKLTITRASDSVENIVSGTPKDFAVSEEDVKDGATVTRQYSVTAPRNAEYAVVMKLEKDDMTAPTVTVQYGDRPEKASSTLVNGYADGIKLKMGQKLTVSFTAAAAVKGTLTVRPVTKEEPDELKDNTDTTVKVSAGDYAYYRYVVPAPGRYQFSLTPAKDNEAELTNIKVDNKDEDESDVLNGRYFNMHQVVEMQVRTGKLTEQTATLKAAAIKPTTLAADTEVTLNIAAGADAYYELKADKHASYNFDGLAGNVFVYKGDSNEPESNSVALEKDETVFVKIHADTEIKDAKCKVTSKVINVVDDTEKSVTIAKSGSEIFEYTVKEKGMYAYRITGAKAADVTLNSGDGRHKDDTADGCYIVREYNMTNKKYTFTIYNTDAEKDATVKVSVTKIVPTSVSADADAKEIVINKGECAYVSFVPTVKGRYTFTTGNDKVEANKFTAETVVEKDADTYAAIKLEVNDPENKSTKETAKVSVKTVKATTWKDSETFTKPVWYEYTAEADAWYSFAVKNGKEDVNAEIMKYNVITDETGMRMPSKLWMAKDEKVLMHIDATAPENVTYSLAVTKTDATEKQKLSFKKTDVEDFHHATYTFTAKKDKEYKVSAVKEYSDNRYSATLTKKVDDEDVEIASISTIGTSATGKELRGFTEDTEVLVTVTVEKSAINRDNNVWIIVDDITPESPEESSSTTPEKPAE